MTDKKLRQKEIKGLSRTARETLNSLDGKKYYAVSVLGNELTSLTFIPLFMALLFGPLLLLFNMLYSLLGISKGSGGRFSGLSEEILNRLEVWTSTSLSAFFIGFAAFFLFFLIIERLVSRGRKNVCAVTDEIGITIDVANPYRNSFPESGTVNFNWNDIDSIRYEFDFPNKNSADATKRPKLYIFTGSAAGYTILLGAPLSLYLSIRKEHPEILVAPDKSRRISFIIVMIIFVIVTAIIAYNH